MKRLIPFARKIRQFKAASKKALKLQERLGKNVIQNRAFIITSQKARNLFEQLKFIGRFRHAIFVHPKKVALIALLQLAIVSNSNAQSGSLDIEFAQSKIDPFNLNTSGLPIGISKVQFIDYDNDGDLDLYVGGGNANGDIQLFVNDGSISEPIFNSTPIIDPFSVSENNVLHVPTFVDIDGDGDLDLFSSSDVFSFDFSYNEYNGITYNTVNSLSNSNIKFFRNNAFSPEGFDFMEEPFTVNLEYNALSLRASRNNALDFVDLDNDGDYDLFTGLSTVERYVHGGGNYTMYYSGYPSDYPNLDYITNTYANTHFSNIVFKENTGTSSSHNFASQAIRSPFNLPGFLVDSDQLNNEFAGPDFIFDRSYAFGVSVPAFGDIDDDGDLDILTALYDEIGVCYSNNYCRGELSLNFIENIGSSSNPSFSSTGLTSLNLDLPQDINITTGAKLVNFNPVLIDLDDDGDLDIFATYKPDLVEGSKFIYWENLSSRKEGRLYWDKNNNNQFDVGDEKLAGVEMTIMPGGITINSNSLGFYDLPDDLMNGEYILTVPDLTQYGCFGTNAITIIANTPSDGSFEFTYHSDSIINQDFIYSGNGSVECPSISGTVFLDVNKNGNQDVEDIGLQGILVSNNNNYSAYSQADGSYVIKRPVGDDIQINIELDTAATQPAYYCSIIANTLFNFDYTFPPDPYMHLVSTTNGMSAENLDFGVSIDTILPGFDARLYTLRVENGNEAGETFNAWIDFKYNGGQTEACTLKVKHDPLLELQSASIPTTNSGVDFVEWIFVPGTAPNSFCMIMEWELDSTATEGDILHWEASYNCPPLMDNCTQNDSIIRDIEILSGPLRLANSEILELQSVRPEGIMPEVLSEEDFTLSYVISFENTLYDTIYDMVIIDTLSEELNIKTVSQPFSSHPYSFQINDNVLVWTFEDINLPNSEIDNLNSYGFTQFNVILEEGLEEGTIIPNKTQATFNGNPFKESNEISHVIGSISPEALCVDEVEIFLDENGAASILPEMIDDGSTDNGSIDLLELDQEDFTCDNLGNNVVELMVTDNDDNTDMCSSNVVVQDTIAPNIECEDLNLMIQQGETLEITADDISINSTDACGIQSSILSKTSFTTADQGSNSITLTVTDMNGNNTTCDVNVEVTIVTDILENQFGITTSIAPNPFFNQTTLQFSKELPFYYNAQLFDVTGKEVRSYMNQSSTKLQIEKQSLSSGIYFLNLYESGKEEVLGSYKLVVE